MKGYKNVLIGVELIDKNDSELIKHAKHLTKELRTNVTLVHAIEYISDYSTYGVGISFEIEKILIKNSKKAMKALGEHIGIPEKRRIVKVGPAKYVILEEAEKNRSDLIIVGSHGRHGLRAVLGSTAEGVLHGAKCDVLAVRLKT